MRILVLGAGFGGLELTTRLSEEFAEDVDVVLIDQSDGFVFGFSKLDVMFGRTTPSAVRHPYRDVVKPGVQFVQSTVRSIDPATNGSRPTPDPSRQMSWSSPSGPTCTRRPRRAWSRVGTSSTRFGGPSQRATSWPIFRVAE